MKYIEFHVNYHTNAGDTLVVDLYANNIHAQRIIMQTENAEEWHSRTVLNLSSDTHYTYNYAILNNGCITIKEKVFPPRMFQAQKELDEYVFFDIWRWDIRQLNLNSSAFTKCVFPAKTIHKIPTIAGSIIFKICAILPIRHKYRIVLSGSAECLGNWNIQKGKELKPVGLYEYSVSLQYCTELFDTRYKYVIFDETDGNVMWELYDNRTISARPCAHGGIISINDGWIRLPEYTDWRGAGIVVPLFSLHSYRSAGIGDFGDLKRFVSWAEEVGFSAVQLLPINDTITLGSWRDSYPYNIISAFALNPIYIDLRNRLFKGTYAKSVYEETCKKLNRKKCVDFATVLQFKKDILKIVYKKIGNKVLATKSADEFVKKNTDWLFPYAAFCCLRDKYKSIDSSSWKGFESYNRRDIECDVALLKHMRYYFFEQYIAHKQMTEVHKAACKRGIILKGDIPIGVNLHSVDVWTNPDYFNCDMSAGAPPDYFSQDGQNWGFPTYNWDAMKKDGYSWWKKRLNVMSQYFDAYRIDHVLGFFRIWEIPRSEKSAKKGHFSPALPYEASELNRFGFYLQEEQIGKLFLRDKQYPQLLHVSINAHEETQYQNLNTTQKTAFDALYEDFFYYRHNDFWANCAIEKLNAVCKSTDMLPCAEDLGMLPHNIGQVLRQLNILSLEVQSMPKQNGMEFSDTHLYPYRSVATLSTHDMPSFRLWWQRFRDKGERYAREVLHTDDVPKQATPQLCESVMLAQLHSPSMLCLLSFQDWTSVCASASAEDVSNEQINDPSDPDQHWCYKTHLSIEDLLHNETFKDKIKDMLNKSNRNLFCHHFAE